MVDATTQLLSRWGADAAAGKAVEIGPEMSRFALAIASRTLFDRDVSQEADSGGKAFTVVAHYLEARFNHPFTSLPSWVPTATNRRFKQAVRRADGRDHGDLLSMLMQARDEESGESMTNDQVRSESLTFLIADHETTATALTWTWYLLATHASIRHGARAEVERVLGKRAPTFADAAYLNTTRMVIEESMRLYPPIWALVRKSSPW